MKYATKHPDGTTYYLTFEEMQSPQLIKQLNIDSSWTVKDGEKWVSINAFIWEQNQKQNLQPTKKTTLSTDNLLAADAPWTPGSVFGLVVRLVGLYLIWHGTNGFVDLVSGFPPKNDTLVGWNHSATHQPQIHYRVSHERGLFDHRYFFNQKTS